MSSAAAHAPNERRASLSPVRAAELKARAAASAALLAAPLGAHPARRPELDYPKVFVVGCPRSGTTWVADALAAHPRVLGGPESHAFPIVYGALGSGGRVRSWARLLYAYDRSALLERPTGLHHYVDRSTLLALTRAARAVGGDDRDRTASALIRSVFDTYFVAARDSQSVLVEKTPQHFRWGARILRDYPEAHLVEVVRDGRDACVSMQMRARQVPVVPAGRREQITLWVEAVRAGLALRRDPAWEGRVSVVHYEEMKADPVGTIARLQVATGLGDDLAVARASADATDISRYTTGAGHFRFRGEQGAWREHFSDDDVRLFQELVGPLFVEAGYSYDD
jgi:hypothetical protein